MRTIDSPPTSTLYLKAVKQVRARQDDDDLRPAVEKFRATK
jgi:hypothetical protein